MLTIIGEQHLCSGPESFVRVPSSSCHRDLLRTLLVARRPSRALRITPSQRTTPLLKIFNHLYLFFFFFIRVSPSVVSLSAPPFLLILIAPVAPVTSNPSQPDLRPHVDTRSIPPGALAVTQRACVCDRPALLGALGRGREVLLNEEGPVQSPGTRKKDNPRRSAQR